MICETCIHNAVCKYGEVRSNGLYCTGEKCKQYQSTADVVPIAELDILKSTITQKEEEAYNRGYADATKEIFAEIESIFNGKKYVPYPLYEITELKKKHTKQCPDCKHFVGCEKAVWTGHCDQYEEKHAEGENNQ